MLQTGTAVQKLAVLFTTHCRTATFFGTCFQPSRISRGCLYTAALLCTLFLPVKLGFCRWRTGGAEAKKETFTRGLFFTIRLFFPCYLTFSVAPHRARSVCLRARACLAMSYWPSRPS